MAKKKTVQATADPPKSRTRDRSRDRHKQPRLAFHLPQELLDAFNDYVQSLPGPPSESSILRGFLMTSLRSLGRWPRVKESE
jgi:hypothetical protein